MSKQKINWVEYFSEDAEEEENNTKNCEYYFFPCTIITISPFTVFSLK